MGSVTRRFKSQQTRDLRRAAAGLVKRAVTRETHNDDCVACEGERFAEMITDGWRMRLSCRVHGLPDSDVKLEHWHLVMQLDPPGRPERDADWPRLAEIVARVAEHTGYDGAYLKALAPIDAAPHAPHHFVWHEDNSLLDDATRRALARRIALL